MTTVVVTGAAGFIGRRLCAALREHARVRAIVRRGPSDGPWDEAFVADLVSDAVPARPFDGADVVFHLAAKVHAIAERSSDDDAYRRVNVDGTQKLLEAAVRSGVSRFVFASSVKAMGESDADRGPRTPYGRSKRDAEALVRESGVRETVVLRPALVYGAEVEGNLGAMLRAVAAGRFPPPPRVANRRAMIHVDDVVRAAIASSQRSNVVDGTFVLGDGVPYSTYSIYASMRRALGLGVPHIAVPAGAWRALARAGDAMGFVARRRAPFDSLSFEKLFGSAWYEPADMRATFGIERLSTLDDALPAMVARLSR